MRLKDMFAVPEGQKVTEKQLIRVLTTSICSIVLCMSCLVSTTWALFAVTIENTDNEIQIGTPEIVVQVDGGEFKSGNLLTSDSHTISIAHANLPDDLSRKSTLYVTLTVQRGTEAPINAYITLNHEKNYAAQIDIKDGKDATLSWEVSWFAPVNAIELIDNVLTIPGKEDVEETTNPTETDPTEGSTEPTETDPTEGSSEPTEPDPSEESSEPTEPDPSEESSEPIEPDPSEESSEPADPDPSEESSEPTDPGPTEGSSEPTDPDPTEGSSEPTEADPPAPSETQTDTTT